MVVESIEVVSEVEVLSVVVDADVVAAGAGPTTGLFCIGVATGEGVDVVVVEGVSGWTIGSCWPALTGAGTCDAA